MKKVVKPLFLISIMTLVGCGGGESKIPFEYTFSDLTVTYDGNAHSIFVDGDIPEGIEISYLNNGQINAGTYTIKAHIEDTTGKYSGIPEEDVTATLTIEKATLNVEDFCPSVAYTYDYQAHKCEIIEDNLPSGLTARFVDSSSYVAVGTYEYQVIVEDTNEYKNYVIEDQYISTLTIGKITLNESDFVFESKSFAFDGESHSITVTYADGSAVPGYYGITYENNDQLEEGTYTVAAHLGYNESIFENKLDLTATLTIGEQAKPTKVGDKYYMGRYPQRLVTKNAIKDALANMTETNEYGYYEFEGKQYIKVAAKHYSETSTPKMEGYGEYYIGQIMYFEVAPICWIVCEINNGQYLLRSKNALDVVNYYEGEARTGKYNSDYRYSTIRAFLNGLDGTSYGVKDFSKKDSGFLSRAFTTQEVNKLVTMTVANADGASYSGTSTQDKVMIISNSEIRDTELAFKYGYIRDDEIVSNTYYDSNAVYGSQYTIARGAKYRIEYGQYSLQVRTMTRTPYGDNGHWYLECDMRKFGSTNYSTKVKDSFDACIPIITAAL